MNSRILAIDDSEQNLTLIDLYLQDTEFDLVPCRDSRDALALVRQEEFDLILLDVVMPKIDGFELCRRLKADPRTKEIPVIFLTGQMHAEGHKMHAFEIGAVDYLSKPVHGEELVARIRAMLHIRAEAVRLEHENLTMSREVQQLRRETASARDEINDLRTLLTDRDDVPDVLLALDPAGRVIRGQRAFYDFLGARGASVEQCGEQLAELARRASAASDLREMWMECGASSIEFRRLQVSDSGGAGDLLVSVRDVTRERQIRDSLRKRQPRRRVAAEPLAVSAFTMTGCVGSSFAMSLVARDVDKLRNVRSNVLIVGETGTGKELIARSLHFDGKFKDRPFLPIHCGAISPHLIESELFGHEKGAFTGADRAARGLFVEADGGTVFLDEISETTPDLQVKLLRVLQLGEVRPVGSVHAQHVDVRFLAATNTDLLERVGTGQFREDLYYRLNVACVEIPPLRGRIADILPLAQHFLEVYAARHELEDAVTVSSAAAQCLEEYSWPGNVRELENAMNRAISMGCTSVLQPHDLPDAVRDNAPPSVGAAAERRETVGSSRRRPRPLETVVREHEPPRAGRRAVERESILDALRASNGDRSAAAAILGVSRSTFYRRLREFSMLDDEGLAKQSGE